jgi:cytoplasmic iron level regulating protein YaaA (DUF328/UPF0246 family)
MAKNIVLISCVSKKKSYASLAVDLYTSDWFTKAADYAAKHADRWYILSAKYGLVFPDQVNEPYDLTLKKLSVSARRAWARQVFEALKPYLSAGDHVVILAGKAYREFLVDPIKKCGCFVEVPMEGMRIGEQLKWLKNRLMEE